MSAVSLNQRKFLCLKKSISAGRLIRREIFSLMEKLLSPVFTCQEYASLYIKIGVLYSSPTHESDWITYENMSEREQAIGQQFRIFRRFASILQLFIQPEWLDSSRVVFEGLLTYGIHILPEFWKDNEPDCVHVAESLNVHHTNVCLFCASWREFHGQEALQKARDMKAAIDANEDNAIEIMERLYPNLSSELEELKANGSDAEENDERIGAFFLSKHPEHAFWLEKQREFTQQYENEYSLAD